MDKEILEGARHCMNFTCAGCPLNYRFRCHGNPLMFAKAIIEQHERYRWHDLRKDPDDLPTEYTRNFECVELWFDGDKTVSIGTASYISECAFGKSLSDSYEVIAWREIDLEQFESEDELK